MLLASDVPSLSWAELLLRLALAAGLGAAIGFERELRDREAGLRTHTLVSLGAALFTIAGAYGFRDFHTSFDPTRIAAQVVTGIGFLGAGAIIRMGLSVRGLTTAATLWVAAAIGLTAGAGYYAAAVITTAIVLLSLWPLRIVAYRILTRFRPETDRLMAQIPSGASPGPLIAELEELGVKLEALEISQEADRRTVLLDLTVPPQADTPGIVAKLSDVPEVLEVRWAD